MFTFLFPFNKLSLVKDLFANKSIVGFEANIIIELIKLNTFSILNKYHDHFGIVNMMHECKRK